MPQPTQGGVSQPVTRRQFISWLGLAWVSFTAACLGGLTLLVRFLFPNVLFEPPTSFKIGPPSDFTVGQVDERFKRKYGIWVVRQPDILYVLITICTHLGCTPNWLEMEGKFKCPCHGSGFRKTGINFEGPAPRPLERAKVMLAEDGQILVDKGKKFQYELGAWNDPESFLRI